MKCSIADKCGGCTDFHAPLSLRLARKKEPAVAFLQRHSLPLNVPILHVGEEGIRDKVDLQYRSGCWGFFGQNRAIVATRSCPKVAPELNAFLKMLWSRPMPIERASVRLRHAPDHTLGIWIDAANVDIARLLKEETWLRWLQMHAAVEIGQKHKRLKEQNGTLKLQKKNVLFPWFETHMPSGERQPIFTTIGGFTQPSIRINHILVQAVLTILQTIQPQTWLEFGSGAGNFSLPLSQLSKKLYLSESNPIARIGLLNGLSQLKAHAPYILIE